jgi:hypothetical protein
MTRSHLPERNAMFNLAWHPGDSQTGAIDAHDH